MPLNLKTVETNANTLIDQGLQGDGVLAGPINDIFNYTDAKLRGVNDSKQKRGLPGVLSDEELKKSIDAEYRKTVDEKIRQPMQKVAKGEAVSFDLKDVAGLAGAASSTWDAFKSLNPLVIIPSVLTLVGNSIIGDYVKGIVMSFSDREKYPSIGDAMKEVQIERSVANAAQQFKIDGAELFAALTKDNAPATAPAAPAATNAAPAENAKPIAALVKPGSENVLSTPQFASVTAVPERSNINFTNPSRPLDIG